MPLGKFYFTQTSIKDFEKGDTCPFRWKSQWLEQTISFPSSEDMDKGKYFEQLAIGAGAVDGDSVTDLPRLKTGAKSADQLRIEAQADRCKRMFNPMDPEWLGLNIVRTQEEIIGLNGRKGTLDIVAEDTSDVWIIDLKLTRDLTSDRTPYGWGNNWSDMDLLQQVHYESLFESKYGVRPKLAVLVFDYSPVKRVEWGEIKVSEKKRVDKEIRFKAAEEVKTLYDKNGWIKIPSTKECEGCPLKCTERAVGSKLIKKTINY